MLRRAEHNKANTAVEGSQHFFGAYVTLCFKPFENRWTIPRIEIDVCSQIGEDLVAMCVNDLIVANAEPLFFLDYYATGHLDVDVAESVIASIANGCELSGCALAGGETAEMPGMYHGGDYDLAGFCVGVAEESKILDGTAVRAGNAIIGLPSSGPHSNGYS